MIGLRIRDAAEDVRSIMASKTDPVTPASSHTRELLRDPAVWAWLLVALLAIVPAHAALAYAVHDAPVAHAPR